MEFKKDAQAGTLESSDVLVLVSKSSKDLEIDLTSSVEEIYGDEIRALISDVVAKLGVKNIALKIEDKGAFDFVIKARVQAAIFKACEIEVPQWSKL